MRDDNTAPTAWKRFEADLLVSLVTGPFLLGVVGSYLVMELLQGLGEMSEEIFRGDRLPILDFPPNFISR
jgi:hypothetical protein